MTVDQNTLLSSQKTDYKWPQVVPLSAKPTAPPPTTKPKNFYVTKLVEPYCHCDAHLYNPQLKKYKQLKDKQQYLKKELECLDKHISLVSGEILDHPCDNDDEKLTTIYQIDYNSRDFQLLNHQRLQKKSGVSSNKTGALMKGYRDPTKFRYSTFVRPAIDVCPDVHFKQTPQSVLDYNLKKMVRTEYQDTVSKNGLKLMETSQQYLEPSPSSRRRVDICL